MTAVVVIVMMMGVVMMYVGVVLSMDLMSEVIAVGMRGWRGLQLTMLA